MFARLRLFSLVMMIIFIANAANNTIRPTRLLPVDGSMVHCAGQMNQDFTEAKAFYNYSQYLGEANAPVMFMVYFGVTLPPKNLTDYMNGLYDIIINQYEAKGQYLTIQVGLWLYGFDQQVADGQFDEQIQIMLQGFKNISHPVYMRIGYEFNGQWTKFQPDTFIAAWQRITNVFRKDPWGNKYVANIWDYSPEAESARFPWQTFYPGDEWVDWWAVNVFGTDQLKLDSVAEFMQIATERNFAIMIGESSTENQSNPCVCSGWDFYENYFNFILNPKYNIKAFCYINWNWCEAFGAPWGNARIEECSIGPQYKSKIAANQGPYMNVGDKATVLKKLGLS